MSAYNTEIVAAMPWLTAGPASSTGLRMEWLLRLPGVDRCRICGRPLARPYGHERGFCYGH